MIKYAKLQIKDSNPMIAESQYHVRTASNAIVQQCRPGHRYYVVGGLHGDVPNNNGDYFRWSGELLRDMIGKSIFAKDEIDKERFGESKFMYETWRGRGNYVNHNNTPRTWGNPNRVGTIIDVYPDMENKCIDFLLEVEEARAPWLVAAIDKGDVTDTSMGTYVEWSKCSHCDHIAEDEQDWCDCLKTAKGHRCPNPARCKGGCAEHNMCYEDNRDCTGLEDSWIVAGHGADPKATHKYTLANDNGGNDTMPRAGEHRGGIDPDLSREILMAKNARNGVSTDDPMRKMAEELGVDKLTEMGLDPRAYGLTRNASAESVARAIEAEDDYYEGKDVEGMIKEAEAADQTEAQKPLVLAEAKKSRLAAIDAELGQIAMQRQNAMTRVSDPSRKQRILARVKAIEDELIAERVVLAGEDKGETKVAKQEDIIAGVKLVLAAQGKTADEETIKRIVAQQMTTVPSEGMTSTIPDLTANSNPESMISGEKPGKDHSVTAPEASGEIGQPQPGTIAVPSAGMKNESEKDNHSVTEDPTTMINPEIIGKSHDGTGPGMTTAMLAEAIALAMQKVAQSTGQAIPNENYNEEGDKSYDANENPESMINDERPGKSYIIEIPESGAESKATDAALPTGSTKADELGNKSYDVNDDPSSMISPEKFGHPHDVKPSVEAAKKGDTTKTNLDKAKGESKRPKCPTCSGALTFGKCPNCNKKIKKADWAAKLIIDAEDHTRTAWHLTAGGEPKMRVAIGDAFMPETVNKYYDFFCSPDYAKILMDTIDERGLKVTAMQVSGQLIGGPPADDKESPSSGPGGPNAKPGGGFGGGAPDGGSKPITPNPKVSDDINNPKDKNDMGVEDVLVGVLAVIAVDGQATVDEIKDFLDGLKDPASLEKFNGRLEQEINDIKDEDKDMGDAVDGKDGGEDKPKPPAPPKKDGGNPFDKKDGGAPGGNKPPMGGGGKLGFPPKPGGGNLGGGKPPVMAQAKEPAGEDARAYFAQIFPPEFVAGLFAGETKQVTAALQYMEKAGKETEALKERNAKAMQLKRVDKLMEEMASKNLLVTAADVMASEGLTEDKATVRVAALHQEKRLEFLDMDDTAFESFAKVVREAKAGSSQTSGTKIAVAGLRTIPTIKTAGDPISSLMDAENAIDGDNEVSGGLFSVPPVINERTAITRSQKAAQRRDSMRTAQLNMVDDEPTGEDILSTMFTSPGSVDED